MYKNDLIISNSLYFQIAHSTIVVDNAASSPAPFAHVVEPPSDLWRIDGGHLHGGLRS